MYNNFFLSVIFDVFFPHSYYIICFSVKDTRKAALKTAKMVCVCVCVRERETEMTQTLYYFSNTLHKNLKWDAI